ncbi:hypothetical protein [Streptomyces sp. NPDC005385]
MCELAEEPSLSTPWAQALKTAAEQAGVSGSWRITGSLTRPAWT